MSLAVSSLLAAVFVLNVALGAGGWGAFLSDVQEMLVLLAASAAFVVAILRREARAREHTERKNQQD
ncbi:MAG TPA: hypothetical protein DCX34_08225 [Roseovarius sp.]|jgi:membrane protein implicated in regulation of membrane protease activity|nr:hypothetical protein [Roseovarius sp.]